jgi:glycosyltransferase involved in cell wall biosynthesis
VEDYIEKCIVSLFNQSLDPSNFELIVVNDGTLDRSIELVEELIAKNDYSNIRIVHQNNQGLAAARNTGIKYAIGKYILFVDPDDFLIDNTVIEIIDFAEKNQLELAMFSQVWFDLKGNSLVFGMPDNANGSAVMTGNEVFKFKKNDSVCKSIYLRSLIVDNHCYFSEDVGYFEDAEWGVRISSFAKRAAFKNIEFYVYQLRPGSLTTSNSWASSNAIQGYLRSAKNLKLFIEKNKPKEIGNFNETISKFVILPFIILVNEKQFKRYRNTKKLVENAGFKKLEIEGLQGIKKLYGNLYNFSPFLLVIYLIYSNAIKSIKLRLKIK